MEEPMEEEVQLTRRRIALEGETQCYEEEEATEEVQLVEEVLRLAHASLQRYAEFQLCNPYIFPGGIYWKNVFPIGVEMYVHHTAASLRLVKKDGSIALAELRRNIVNWLDAGADEGTISRCGTVRDLYQEELERSGKRLPKWLVVDSDPEWPEWLVDSDPDGM
jgi:hypothetical protein